MRLVRWLIAAIVVQHSKTASWAGRGTLWKWSYTQIESKPSSSARTAISTALIHFASAPSIPTSSIFQPWGMNTPNTMSSLIRRNVVVHVSARFGSRRARVS